MNNSRKIRCSLDNLCIPSLSSIDETILVNRGSPMSFLWKFVHRWITRLVSGQSLLREMLSIALSLRFQMYYTYRQARLRSPSLQVHIQPLKSFRSLFQVFELSPPSSSHCFSTEQSGPDPRLLRRRSDWMSTLILDISPSRDGSQLAADNEDLLQSTFPSCIDLRTNDGHSLRLHRFFSVGFPSHWSVQRECRSSRCRTIVSVRLVSLSMFENMRTKWTARLSLRLLDEVPAELVRLSSDLFSRRFRPIRYCCFNRPMEKYFSSCS